MPKRFATEWQAALDPFARLEADYAEKREALLKTMSDEELAALLDATEKPTQTNCWWATYRAAAALREAISAEAYARSI